MSYHPITQKIIELLQSNECWYESFEHAPILTSEEAALTRPGYSLKQGAKAIIIRIKRSNKDKFFAMLVFPADCKFDVNKIKSYFSAKDVRFATNEEVAELTNGVQSGGVPPFGHLFKLPVYVAPQLFANDKIAFNAGDRSFSIAMNTTNYEKLSFCQRLDML